jgi:zinc transport system substrate-binding protein
MYNILRYISVLFVILMIAGSLPVAFSSSTNSSFIDLTNTTESTQSVSINLTTNQSRLKIVATFYPIYEFVKKVGGDKVDVSTLIPIGVEPHDFDPTIQQIQDAESADLVIYNGAGFERWIDKINAKFKIDASQGLSLLTNNDTERAGGYDPHVWLDPILAQAQVEKIKDVLVNIDPANSQYYQANANKFIAELNSLDNKIKTDLAACNKKDFIAFHNAFTYFADRYGLNQHSIHDIAPEGEVLPQRLQEVIQLAKDLGLNTIYSEDLVDPRSAEVIAQEIPNGKVLILSPIEGINAEEQEAGVDYLDKMNQDIDNLKIGLECQAK